MHGASPLRLVPGVRRREDRTAGDADFAKGGRTRVTSTGKRTAAALVLLLGTAPATAVAVERTRTTAVTGLPLAVGEPAPNGLLWAGGTAWLDGSPLAMTLSDGGRWQATRPRARWELTTGLAVRRVAAEMTVGDGVFGLSLQIDPVVTSRWRVGVTLAGRATGQGGDLSAVPAWSGRWPVTGWLSVAPFAGARLRWGQTRYDVQGWDADRANPHARAQTRDLALAPLAGAAAVTRFVELRATAGWEFLLMDELLWGERPTALSRDGGPFVVLALRLKLGGTP